MKECACPYCADIECELRALRTQFVPCKNNCDDCKTWKRALNSVDTWMDHFSCDEEYLTGYKRADCNEEFKIRAFKCCLDKGSQGYVLPCDTCSDVNLRLPFGSCETFNESNMEKSVMWLKRQPTVEGAKHDKLVNRLRTFKGKLSELIVSVLKRTKPYMEHMWRCRFLRRQFHLDCDFFDPNTEALLLADLRVRWYYFICIYV